MKINRISSILAVLILAIIFSSCSSIKITSDYDKSVDFTKYKTFEYYGWAKESDKLLNDLDKKRIEDAFSNELYKRGLSYVATGGDLIVTLFIVIEDKTQTTAQTSSMGGGYYGGHYGYGPGWGWGPSYSTTTVSTYDYKYGTLVCDVFDKTDERLIWEGIGSKSIVEDPKNRDKSIPYAVAKIMAEYPIAPVEE